MMRPPTTSTTRTVSDRHSARTSRHWWVAPDVGTCVCWCPTSGHLAGLWGRVGDRAAVASVPRGVPLARPPQVPAVDVRPQRVEEDKLGVRALPEQKVRRTLLARRPDEEVDVRQLRLVQVCLHRRLVDVAGIKSSGRHIASDSRCGISYLRATAIVDAHRQGEAVVGPGELLRILELIDDALPQPPSTPRPAHSHAHLVHLVAATADDLPVEAHEEPHLLRGATPVLRREGVRGDVPYAELEGPLHHVEQRSLAGLVTRCARQAA